MTRNPKKKNILFLHKLSNNGLIWILKHLIIQSHLILKKKLYDYFNNREFGQLREFHLNDVKMT